MLRILLRIWYFHFSLNLFCAFSAVYGRAIFGLFPWNAIHAGEMRKGCSFSKTPKKEEEMAGNQMRLWWLAEHNQSSISYNENMCFACTTLLLLRQRTNIFPFVKFNFSFLFYYSALPYSRINFHLFSNSKIYCRIMKWHKIDWYFPIKLTIPCLPFFSMGIMRKKAIG